MSYFTALCIDNEARQGKARLGKAAPTACQADSFVCRSRCGFNLHPFNAHTTHAVSTLVQKGGDFIVSTNTFDRLTKSLTAYGQL